MKTNHKKTQVDKKRILILSPLNFFLAFSILLSALCLESCKKFVEIPSPPTQVLTTAVFGASANATSAMLNVYAQMYNQDGYNLDLATGLLGDELTN